MSSDFENPAVRRDLAGLNWDAICGVQDDDTEEISEEMATEELPPVSGPGGSDERHGQHGMT
ncbi:hypothetical protein ACFZDJ_01575 [Streptomyces sp. NPDC007896]|uniref:hypothetical protein n=1 Tax=Streptomyces sp. NPDC007896 TaxID=3364784 RepID=UPI0036DFC104